MRQEKFIGDTWSRKNWEYEVMSKVPHPVKEGVNLYVVSQRELGTDNYVFFIDDSFTPKVEEDKVENSTISEVASVEDTVEKKTLSEVDKLKLALLYDLVTDEVEYCFDLGYNSSETWTLEERVKGLIDYINLRVSQEPQDIIKDYDYERFSEALHNKIIDVCVEFKVGDTIYFDNEECTIIDLGYKTNTNNYAILSNTFHNVVHVIIGDLNEELRKLSKLTDRIGVRD
jgi:hypothetical protein